MLVSPVVCVTIVATTSTVPYLVIVQEGLELALHITVHDDDELVL